MTAAGRDDVFWPVFCYLRPDDLFRLFQPRLRGLVRGTLYGLRIEDLEETEQMTWIALQKSPPHEWQGVGQFIAYLKKILKQQPGKLPLFHGHEQPIKDDDPGRGRVYNPGPIRLQLQQALLAVVNADAAPAPKVAFLFQRVVDPERIDAYRRRPLQELLQECIDTLEDLVPAKHWRDLTGPLVAAINPIRSRTLEQYGTQLYRDVENLEKQVIRAMLPERASGGSA